VPVSADGGGGGGWSRYAALAASKARGERASEQTRDTAEELKQSGGGHSDELRNGEGAAQTSAADRKGEGERKNERRESVSACLLHVVHVRHGHRESQTHAAAALDERSFLLPQ